MHCVLGIDAAWTSHNPSGVALVVQTEGEPSWRLIATFPSFECLHAMASCNAGPAKLATAHEFNAEAIVYSSQRIANAAPNIVAMDIPLAQSPITKRRISDNLVSSRYGARKCGTHSPTCKRPGLLSEQIRDQFAVLGYQLATRTGLKKCLVEVYPHPALIELTGAKQRLPYKVGKIRNYWPDLKPAERRECLREQWAQIVSVLDNQIAGVSDLLPLPVADAKRRELKAFEDRLDAIICAWVAICVIEGRAVPLGDDDSAIWVPSPIRLTAS